MFDVSNPPLPIHIVYTSPKIKELGLARAYPSSAGLDLRTTEEINISPGRIQKVDTGIKLAIPTGFAGFIFPRSGIASKTGIVLANTVGIIDPEYRGPIICALKNTSQMPRYLSRYSKVAQLVIMPIEYTNLVEVEELPESLRGSNGFGSTGV